MGAPTFWDNQEKAQRTIKQLKPLNALLNPFDELTSSIEDLGVLGDLAEEDPRAEPELESELVSVEKRLDDFELRAMLSGPQDASDAFVRIQAGTGGTEACDWAAMLMRMYTRWAEQNGFQVDLIDELRNDEAGIRSATVKVAGDNAYGFLQSETGVHRLVRI